MWEPGAATRIGVAASFASVAIGLLLAAFQVQGWTMPKLLAVVLIVLLLVMVTVALSVIVYEVVKAVRRYLEHRATSAAWVSSEAPGLLDFEADGIRATDRFTDELTRLGKDTARLGKKQEKHTKHFEGRLKTKSGKAKQRRANRSAKDVYRSAVFIEKRLALFKALVKDIFRNYGGLIANLELEDEEDFASATEFRNTLEQNRAETAEALASTMGYRDSVKSLEAMNVSRTVRIASNRLGKALDGVVTVLKQFERNAGQLVREFDTKLSRGGRN